MMKKTILAAVFGLIFLAGVFQPVSAVNAEGITLSQMIELFISLGIISPDKAVAARAAVSGMSGAFSTANVSGPAKVASGGGGGGGGGSSRASAAAAPVAATVSSVSAVPEKPYFEASLASSTILKQALPNGGDMVTATFNVKLSAHGADFTIPEPSAKPFGFTVYRDLSPVDLARYSGSVVGFAMPSTGAKVLNGTSVIVPVTVTFMATGVDATYRVFLDSFLSESVHAPGSPEGWITSAVSAQGNIVKTVSLGIKDANGALNDTITLSVSDANGSAVPLTTNQYAPYFDVPLGNYRGTLTYNHESESATMDILAYYRGYTISNLVINGHPESDVTIFIVISGSNVVVTVRDGSRDESFNFAVKNDFETLYPRGSDANTRSKMYNAVPGIYSLAMRDGGQTSIYPIYANTNGYEIVDNPKIFEPLFSIISKSISTSGYPQDPSATSTLTARFDVKVAAIGGPVIMNSAKFESAFRFVRYVNGVKVKASEETVTPTISYEQPTDSDVFSSIDGSFMIKEGHEVTIPVTYTIEGRLGDGSVIPGASGNAMAIGLDSIRWMDDLFHAR